MTCVTLSVAATLHPSKPKAGFHPNAPKPGASGTPGLLGTPALGRKAKGPYRTEIAWAQ